jgi:hypothetical protein
METVEVASQSSSTAAQKQDAVHTDMSDGAYCVEKDFKSERTHQSGVTGLAYINEREFFTASQD